jgi:dTDP-glucose 4,6-dehydratase
MSEPGCAGNRSFQDIANADFERLQGHLSAISLSGRAILVSGATGFFGAWLLALFNWWATQHADQRFHVYAVSRNPSAFISRHSWIANVTWLTWIEGDIRSFEHPAVKLDWVLHAATDTSAEAGRNPSVLLDAIIGGTRHILGCAKACGASRVLLVSSGGVYGAQPGDVDYQSETSTSAPNALEPGNTYGESKRVMELLGAIHAKETSSTVTVARCFAFVGPGLPLDGHFAIGNFIRDALSEPNISIRGDGRGVRSYLYAADLAVWLLVLLVKGANQRAYNVGSDRDLSIADLARQVLAVLAPQKTLQLGNEVNSSPVGNRYVPSIERARSELNLDVWTPLSDAIAATAAWKPAHV